MSMDEKTAERCAEAVLENLLDRSGFDEWWEVIDTETQQEIQRTMASVIRTASGKEGGQ